MKKEEQGNPAKFGLDNPSKLQNHYFFQTKQPGKKVAVITGYGSEMGMASFANVGFNKYGEKDYNVINATFASVKDQTDSSKTKTVLKAMVDIKCG